MSLVDKVNVSIKDAMKAKDQVALASLRAIKSAILLAQSESSNKELSEEDEVKILQKLAKQRREAAEVYKEQGREDLANEEEAQLEIIESFLPEQMSEEELEFVVQEIIEELNAQGMQDMGKVMAAANQKVGAKSDGKTISGVVKRRLSS